MSAEDERSVKPPVDPHRAARQFERQLGLGIFDRESRPTTLQELMDRRTPSKAERRPDPEAILVAHIVYTRQPDGTITQEMKRLDKETPEVKTQEA